MTQKASSDGTIYRDRSETGTLNEADEAVTLAVEEQDSFACQITTGLTGTLVAEVSVDGGTTYAATEFASKAGGATSSSLVNPGTGAYDILRTAGCTHVRVRCSVYTSGSAVVVLRGTEAPPAAGAGLADIESALDGLEANTAPSAGPLAGAEVVVTTAGTRVRFTASDVPCKAVLICAKKAAGANTGNVYIGNSGVSSSNAIPWAPGSIIEWEVDNVNKLWVDAATNGDAIVYQPIARAS